jgi:hypothetical protein
VRSPREKLLFGSRSHGWPSFREQEAIWEYIRALGDGEIVSLDSTQLGHNLPGRSGNRYCINLCCAAATGKAEDMGL